MTLCAKCRTNCVEGRGLVCDGCSPTTSRAEIEARLAAATPGPWILDGDYVWMSAHRGSRCSYMADAELIAHAPDDLRHLLDVIDRLIQAGDELVKHLHYEGHWDALAAWDEAKAGAA